MSTIDEIMGAVGRHGDDCIRDSDAASESFEALKGMIAAALDDAYCSGAESMRAEAMDCAVNAGRGSLAEEIAAIPAPSPGALPLPTGPRQAVPPQIDARQLAELVTSIREGLEVRRG